MAVVTDTDAGAVVRAFVDDVWNGDDPGALDALTTDDFVLHQRVAGEDHDREHGQKPPFRASPPSR